MVFFFFGFRYTLRNAEYRLCLERNLDVHEGDGENQTSECSQTDLHGMLLNRENIDEFSGKNEFSSEFQQNADDLNGDIGVEGLGEMTLEVQQYILNLQSRLSSIKKVRHSKEPPLVGCRPAYSFCSFVQFHN